MTLSWRRWLVGLTLALAAGCDSNGDGGGGGSGASSCPDFTQITGKSFSPGADSLSWTLTVKDLPAELSFNRPDVPQYVLEYRWGVHLDPDGDGTEDLLVALTHYADGDEVTGDILSHTQQDLWAKEGALGSITGDITVTIEDDTLTFTVATSEDPALSSVTESSGHRFETLYHDGTSPCGDEETGL